MKMKKLPEKFRFLVADQDETFRLYVDRKEIGKKVLASLKTKLDIVDAKKEAKGFYLSSRVKEIGLISQLYGTNALFTIMNRYGVEFDKEDIDQLKTCVQYVIAHLKENDNCYDLSPILDEDVNNELFLYSGHRYFGAMTWALSLFTAARVAQRKGLIKFTDEEQQEIFKHIKGIVRFFVENVVGTEEYPLGWGYADGCLEPSLFFTYSVVEAFADFDDNILTGGSLGSDDEVIDYINEIKGKNLEEIEEDEKLTNRYKNLCYKIGDRAWNLFKNVLKTDFFSDNFSENFKIISREEILSSSRSSVLFNTLYVIFILFYSYTNVRNEKESEEIINSMTLGLQLIQNFYDELRMNGRESIVDRHIIAYDQPHDTIKDFGKLLNEESIQASPFLPMLVKANNLIAYYILEFPQQQMRELFDMMLEAQMDGENDWLWDKRKYDLLSTERYLESIADFFDYYDKYERNYADKSTTDTKRRKEIREEITPSIERNVEKKLENKHKEAIEKLRENMAEEYPIEVSLNKRIDEKIEERAMGMLTDAIEKIIQYNKAPQKQKASVEESFTPPQKKLKSSLEALMNSYFADDIRVTAMSSNEMKENILSDAVTEDISKFMSEFVKFIAQNNANKPDDKKLSLADIFKLIIDKN